MYDARGRNIVTIKGLVHSTRAKETEEQCFSLLKNYSYLEPQSTAQKYPKFKTLHRELQLLLEIAPIN